MTSISSSNSSSSSTASEILGRIENDAVFRGFLEAGFDPAAFASKIVRADVGRAHATAAGDGGGGSGGVAAPPVLQLKQGGHGVGASSSAVDGGGVRFVASAESVSSQAEITLDSMSSHIARIESAIRAHILDHEEDFLGSVGGVSELSRRTEEFRDGVRELRRSFARVRREVSEPHEAFRLRTQQLKNLHAATRLLKRALRFLSALKRLRSQEEVLGLDAAAVAAAAAGGGVGGTGGGGGGTPARGGVVAVAGGAADLRELAKAAQSLQELEGTLRDPEVSELDVVGRERAYVEACGAAVRRMSADSLARGMKALNQTDIGGALQVFFNLECLPARVRACVVHLADEAEDAVSEALQPRALADALSSSSSAPSAAAAGATGGAEAEHRPKSPTRGGSGGGARRPPSNRDAGAAAARRRSARMRAHAGKLAAALYGTSMEAWGLQRVLDKKRDPTTRALLDATVRADRSGGGGGLSLSAGAYRAYWDGLCRVIRAVVERALEADGVGRGSGGGGDGGGSGAGGEYGVGGSGAALVAMYPFLRSSFLRLIKRLEEGTARHQGSSAVRRSDGGVSGGGGGGGGSSGSSALLWSKAGVNTAGSSTGSGQQPGGRGGVLGGSRWLSLALEIDDDLSLDSSSEGEEQDQQQQLSRRGGGAEAGAGPTSNGGAAYGRRGFGLRGSSGAAGTNAGDGDRSDSVRLLEALAPLRDLFLARSLERLTTPVEQMFPQFDGYMATVPSKHDLASFVRSIHAELALAVPAGSITARQGGGLAPSSEAEAAAGGGAAGSAEADLSLLPILMKGVVQAVRLFCAKVEAMQSVEQGAYAFGGGSGGTGTGAGPDDDMTSGGDMSGMSTAGGASIEAWAPTAEQKHNLQLLELVVKLREALLGIPALVTPPAAAAAAAPNPAASAFGVGGAAVAEGGDSSAAAAATVATTTAAAAAAALGAECRERVAEGVKVLDETATTVFLEPYLSGVARALEDIVSKMHRENFGPGASAAMAMASGNGSGGGGGGGSLFLVELQGALAALQADHFGRIAALRTPGAEAGLRSLAGRILRAYVSHCALIRPLSEAGKARVAQDMATLEIALSPLARVSELGAVYQECRAFRTLLFVDDDGEDEEADDNSQGAGGRRGSRGRDSRSFLTEACMAHLRPTSVWHYLFSRAPDELSSPHVFRGMSEQAYVTWLLGGGAAHEGKAREKGADAEAGGGDGDGDGDGDGGGGGDSVTHGGSAATYTERSTLSPDTSYMAEFGAWGVVQSCLDEYHQRRSVSVGVDVGDGDGKKKRASMASSLPRAVALLPEAGPALLSGYETRGGVEATPISRR